MYIFITGATAGIGLELAKYYLERGHVVGVCGRNLERIPWEISSRYAETMKAYQVDVTSRDELMGAVRDFAQNFGLDIMIANAGISSGEKGRIPNFKLGYDIVHTNLLGLMYAFEVALEKFLIEKKGHLVAISSVAGMIGVPGAAAYSASKAAVLKFCESLAIDLPDQGISVTAIAPGFVDTPLTRKNNHPMPFLLPANLAAALMAKAIEAKKNLFVFPRRMRILILFLQLMPRSCYLLLMRLSSRFFKR